MRTLNLLGICACLALHAVAPLAATYRVGIGDDCLNLPPGQTSCFTPDQLAVQVGDSVEFYQYADTVFTGYHNVVADDGSFRCARGCDDEGGDGTPVSDSYCDATGLCMSNPVRVTFVRTFSQPGSIRYHDEVTKAAGVIFVREATSRFSVSEIYSNPDGSIQFMLFSVSGGINSLGGMQLLSTSGSSSNSFTFPVVDIHEPIARQTGIAMVATRGFADLHLVEPDFVVPDGFFFTGSGSISMRVAPYQQNASYVYPYASLPVDGKNAVYPSIDFDIGAVSVSVAPAVAVNHAGDYAMLASLRIRDVVEYYNGVLDDYFLTQYDDEIAALDAGRIPGWQRTGYGLSMWGGPPTAVIPGLVAVCRVFLGVTHFYSAKGCADAMAVPAAIAETGDAFKAMLPDAGSGACTSGMVAVYRLWNPRGTAHRYTLWRDVRAEMLSRGYLPEGYGPDGVAMCVPDASRSSASGP
jgi:plastocyanin